jgi:2-methylcitrate dehydratase PrpD
MMLHTSVVTRWIASLKWEDIPKDVIQQAKYCLLDFLGCTAGGAQTTPGRICTKAAINWGGAAEASIIGASPHVAARHAAFANGMMANALDFDDTLFGHPGSTTFSASLAAAEKWEASGKEFLLAAIVGYEFSVRAAALMRPLVPRYLAIWDAGALQAYGATAAAARLGKLSESGIANALGIISATAPVPEPRKNRYPGEGRSMLKSCHGWSADAAIVAVEMSLVGLTGPGHVFDDNMGFWNMVSSPDLGITNISEKLGEHWSIRQVEFKPYMSCRFIHPVLQGIEELMRRRIIIPDDIERVEVSSFSLLTDEHHNIMRPVSITDAQFSVPYTVAAMLSRGMVTPESYAEENLGDPDMLSLMDKVTVKVDPEFEKAYPGRLGSQVRIVSKNGQSDEIRVENPKGSPERPMTEEELLMKFQNLSVPLLGRQNTDELAAMINRIDELPNLATLTKLLVMNR